MALPSSHKKATAGLVFPQVYAVSNGTYHLSVAYLGNTSAGNFLTISVNETNPLKIKLEDGSAAIPVQAQLHSGRNKVEIRSGEAVSIDCLTVTH